MCTAHHLVYHAHQLEEIQYTSCNQVCTNRHSSRASSTLILMQVCTSHYPWSGSSTLHDAGVHQPLFMKWPNLASFIMWVCTNYFHEVAPAHFMMQVCLHHHVESVCSALNHASALSTPFPKCLVQYQWSYRCSLWYTIAQHAWIYTYQILTFCFHLQCIKS